MRPAASLLPLIALLAACGSIGPEPEPPAQEILSDAEIGARVQFAFYRAALPAREQIEVLCHSGIVTLSGAVPDEASARRAKELAAEVPGVVEVRSHLRVVPP